jgi:uncharacterized protein YbjT (DUF2867 family)
MKQTILITGSTGTVGQEVVKGLLNKDVTIKVGVRHADKIKNHAWANSVEVMHLDYDEPEGWTNALSGVEKLFLITPAGSYQEAVISEHAVNAAVKANVKHIVRVSGMGANEHNLFGEHQAADDLLMGSSIDYTALQPNVFNQNFYNFSTTIKEEHKIIDPAENGKVSFIDARDIAAVAVKILTEQGHENKIYELTGGESLHYNEVAKLFSNALGFNVTYQPLSPEKYILAKQSIGLPPEITERFIQFFKW